MNLSNLSILYSTPITLFIMLFLIVLPLGLIMYISIKSANLIQILRKVHLINEENQILIKNVLPKKIKNELKENNLKIDEYMIDDVYKKIKEFYIVLVGYVAFWIIYIIATLILIINLIHISMDMQCFKNINLICITQTCMIYLLLIRPLRETFYEIFRRKHDKNLEFFSWDTIKNIDARIQSWIQKILPYIIRFILSFILFYIYIQIAKYFCYIINHTINFEIAYGILFIYQYGLLLFVSFILQKFALKNYSPKCKWPWLKRYITKEKASMSVKSSSYAVMLFVYYIATNNSQLDLPIPLAINTLFLFDTFIAKEKEIQNKREDGNQGAEENE